MAAQEFYDPNDYSSGGDHVSAEPIHESAAEGLQQNAKELARFGGGEHEVYFRWQNTDGSETIVTAGDVADEENRIEGQPDGSVLLWIGKHKTPLTIAAAVMVGGLAKVVYTRRKGSKG